MADQYIRVKYVKSSIGYNQKQKDTVKALGLHRLGQEKVHLATDSIRGMCAAIPHLVAVTESDEAEYKENRQ